MGLVAWFEEVGREDTVRVGGKCASLGEMVKAGIPIPPGFAICVEAFERCVEEAGCINEISKYFGALLRETRVLGNTKRSAVLFATP